MPLTCWGFPKEQSIQQYPLLHVIALTILDNFHVLPTLARYFLLRSEIAFLVESWLYRKDDDIHILVQNLVAVELHRKVHIMDCRHERGWTVRWPAMLMALLIIIQGSFQKTELHSAEFCWNYDLVSYTSWRIRTANIQQYFQLYTHSHRFITVKFMCLSEECFVWPYLLALCTISWVWSMTCDTESYFRPFIFKGFALLYFCRCIGSDGTESVLLWTLRRWDWERWQQRLLSIKWWNNRNTWNDIGGHQSEWLRCIVFRTPHLQWYIRMHRMGIWSDQQRLWVSMSWKQYYCPSKRILFCWRKP